MKVTIATLFAAASIVSAATLPSCASTCAIDNLSKTSCSNETDEACLCKDSTYQAAFETCVESSCDTADQEATEEYGVALCESYGVTLGASSSTSAAAASSSVASTSASTTAVATTSSISSSYSSSSSVISSATYVASNYTASSTGSVYNGTSNATASSTLPLYTGAASQLSAKRLVGIVALLGAAAL